MQHMAPIFPYVVYMVLDFKMNSTLHHITTNKATKKSPTLLVIGDILLLTRACHKVRCKEQDIFLKSFYGHTFRKVSWFIWIIPS